MKFYITSILLLQIICNQNVNEPFYQWFIRSFILYFVYLIFKKLRKKFKKSKISYGKVSVTPFNDIP